MGVRTSKGGAPTGSPHAPPGTPILRNLAGNPFFARSEYIVPELQKVLDRLASEHLLRGADSRGFCERAAYFFGEMNAVHPFREGNGRAQREFLREWAIGATSWRGISFRRRKCMRPVLQVFREEAARGLPPS